MWSSLRHSTLSRDRFTVKLGSSLRPAYIPRCTGSDKVGRVLVHRSSDEAWGEIGANPALMRSGAVDPGATFSVGGVVRYGDNVCWHDVDQVQG